MYHLDCQHSYCATCFRTLITTAIQTESMFPPKCCVADIPLKEIFTALDRPRRELFKSRSAEHALKIDGTVPTSNVENGSLPANYIDYDFWAPDAQAVMQACAASVEVRRTRPGSIVPRTLGWKPLWRKPRDRGGDGAISVVPWSN